MIYNIFLPSYFSTMTQQQQALADQLLQIIYTADDYTTSDLQWIVEAFILSNCK